MNERVSKSISRSIFKATRTGKGNGFNKIMSTGNGFNKKLCIFFSQGRKGKYCLKQLEHAFG